MSKKLPAVTQSKRGGKRSTSWKPGQSGNPTGGPKRGESWKDAIKAVGDMTPAEIATMLGGRGDLQAQFKMMPRNIPIKQLVIMRVFSSLMFEPQPGLLNAFMERTEGKVSQPVDVSWRDEAKAAGYDPDTIVATLARELASADLAGSTGAAATTDSDTMAPDSAT